MICKYFRRKESAGLFVCFPNASYGKEYLQSCVTDSVRSATDRVFQSDIINLIMCLAELGVKT